MTLRLEGFFTHARKLTSWLVFFVVIFSPLFSETEFDEDIKRLQLAQWENGNADLNLEDSKKAPKKLRLTIPKAIEQVIENNTIVQNAKLEIVKADSPELINESKYVWRLLAGVQSSKQLFPNNQNNFFLGTTRTQDRISAGIEKQFRTGTYFKTEVSTLRFDNNAFEQANASSNNQFATLLAAPPMYTGALSFTLSQELLKYGFGKTQEDQTNLLKKQTLLVRENYINILTQLVVKILVDYWSLNIIDSQISTYEKVLKNTQDIRAVTIKKASLGLSERFEVNQWNQAVLRSESLLEKAKVDRIEAERNLVRILNVDTGSSIEGVTDLTEELPTKFNIQEDTEYALKNRIDFLILKRELEIANLALKTAMAEEDPSLLASVSYTSIGQNFLSPQENFIARERGITSFNYPQIFAELKMSYPLWDIGVKATIKERETNIKILEMKLQNLEQEIRQEISTRYENVLSSHKLLMDLKRTKKESESFYSGLLSRFKMGRYTAVNVKNALDSLAQAELGVTQAKTNFNINLVRYELTKNSLFQKYGVDLYAILDELEKRVQSETDKL